MRKLKVLHIHTRAVIGGSGTNTLLSIEGLDSARFEPILACGEEGPLIDEAKIKGLRVITIRNMVNRINLLKDFLSLLELIYWLKREKIDIVHTHNSKAGILGRFSAWLCGTPIIIHTMHSCVFKYPNLNWLERNSYLLIEKWTALFTDRVIFISEVLKKEFLQAKVVSPEKVTVIYSGIEIEKFKISIEADKIKKELGINSEDLIVGTVGRLEEGKGQEFLLQAAAKIIKYRPYVKFIFVGEGFLREKLMTLAKNLDIQDNVIFTGLRQDIPQILAILDVFVFASLYEGMGRVILEAQAAGKPVVATRVGGIPDIVIEGETAILVPPADPSSLCKAIEKLIEDRLLRQKMQERARQFVDYRFSSQKMVEEIAQLYEELIKKKLANA